MKIVILLLANILFSMSTFVYKKTNWFEECLANKSGMERCYEFDVKITREFLKKVKQTAAFSPLNCDQNILMQCASNNSGSQFNSQGAFNLQFVSDQSKKIISENYKSLNIFYEKNEAFGNFIGADCVLNQVLSDIKGVCNEYVNLIKEEFNGLMSPLFDISSFKSYEYILSSMVSVENCWPNKINEENSCDGDFFLNKNEKVKRTFMYAHSSYLYDTNYEGIHYDVVAIPYPTKNDERSRSNYMFYLIPVSEETDLVQIWDSFFKSYQGKVENFWRQPRPYQEIKLYIPKIEKLKSVFDSRELLSEVFNYENTNYSSKMATYLNVDEKSEERPPVRKKPGDSFIRETFELRIDRPYISFFYDVKTKRILLVTKDTGVIEKKY